MNPGAPNNSRGVKSHLNGRTDQLPPRGFLRVFAVLAVEVALEVLGHHKGRLPTRLSVNGDARAVEAMSSES